MGLSDRYENAYTTMLVNVGLEDFSEKELAMFWPVRGSSFVPGQDFLIVGRCLNGWDYSIESHQFSDRSECQKLAQGARERSEPSSGCPMAWVTKQAGDKDGYNTNRSAFLRVAREVACSLSKTLPPDSWSSHISWSNLAKLSPAAEGNPSDKLWDAQVKGCVDLLRLELSELQPRFVLVLAGWNWYSEVLPGYSIRLSDDPSGYVEATARVAESSIVLAKHPQGKPEDQFVQDVLSAFEGMGQ